MNIDNHPIDVAIPATPCSTTPEAARRLFVESGFNLRCLKKAAGAPDWLKGYDPFGGHRPESKAFGTSWFLSKVLNDPNRDPFPPNAVVEVRAGRGGPEKAICVIVTDPDGPVGYTWPTTSWAKMKRLHGSLQPVLEPDPTPTWTFVLNHEGPGGWCLATIHPGLPDDDPDDSGLDEGDRLPLSEVEKRNLRLKVELPKE